MQKIILLSCLLCITTVMAAESYQSNSLSILIDVSGSMKKNDRDNLRVPALRLLMHLLPDNTEAELALFAQDVEPVIPLSPVDAEWKKLAYQQANQIHSMGLRTDIEQALSTVLGITDQNQSHDVVLLTDGVVDVADNAELNQQSIENIKQFLLPQLTQQATRIHTIALSEHADSHLLSQISQTTDGLPQTVLTAGELQPAFIRLLERITMPQQLPLHDNTFTVDESIHDMTLLFLGQHDLTRLDLITPAGKTLNLTTPSEHIRLLQGQTYQVVTISNPEVGEWTLQSEQQLPSIWIGTELRLQSTQLQANITPDQDIAITAKLIEGSSIVTEPSLLNQLNVTVHAEDDYGQQRSWVAYDQGEQLDQKKQDGVFTTAINFDGFTGLVHVTVAMKTPTFERLQRQSIAVQPIIASPSVSPVSKPAVAQSSAEVVVNQLEAETPHNSVKQSRDLATTSLVSTSVTDSSHSLPIWFYYWACAVLLSVAVSVLGIRYLKRLNQKVKAELDQTVSKLEC